MLLPINFRNWLLKVEHSFDPNNPPSFFYICPKFSEDFKGPHPGVTPPGAGCTMIGDYTGSIGISEGENIVGSFWSRGHFAIKMPGKPFVALNKTSKVLYDNPHYMSSRGGRASRRTRSGSKGSHTEHMETIIASILAGLNGAEYNNFVAYDYSGYSIPTESGATLGAKAIVAELKRTPPTDWKRREKIEPESGKKYEKGFKLRSRHLDAEPNHLKTIRGATDLTQRLITIFKKYKVKDLQKVLAPSNQSHPKMTKKPPKLYDAVSSGIGQVGQHPGEKEWVMKRQSFRDSRVGEYTVPVRPEKTLEKIAASEYGDPSRSKDIANLNPDVPTDGVIPAGTKLRMPPGRLAHHPLLHVPIGSMFQFGSPPGGLLPWVETEKRDYEQKHNKPLPHEEIYRYLVNKYKLYKYFQIYFVRSWTANVSGLIPFDPESKDIFGKIKDLAEQRGVRNSEMIKKFMTKMGIFPERMNSMLDRWISKGLIKLQDGKIHFDPSVKSEEHQSVLNYILQNEDGVTEEEIKNEFKYIVPDDIDKILFDLGSEKKISNNNGTYSAFISDEEMGTMNDIEKEIIKQIKERSIGSPRNINIPDVDQSTIAREFRKLKLKGKIYASEMKSGYWSVYADPEEPLSPMAQKVLDFLKEWPADTNWRSLKAKFKDFNDELTNALAELEGHKYVSGDIYNIKVNKDLLKSDSTNEHGYIETQILNLLKDHWLTNSAEIASKLDVDSYDMEQIIYDMQIKNIIHYDYSTSRKLPFGKQLQDMPPSIEEKFMQELLANKALTKQEITDELSNKLDGYYSSTTIDHLLKRPGITSSLDIKKGATVYHSVKHKHEFDTKPIEQGIIDKLSENGPMNYVKLRQEIGEKFEISQNGVKHILDNMLNAENSPIETGQDLWGNTLYKLPHQKIPGAEMYKDKVIELLNGQPKFRNDLASKMRDITGMDRYQNDSIINALQKEGALKSEPSSFGKPIILPPGMELKEAEAIMWQEFGKIIVGEFKKRNESMVNYWQCNDWLYNLGIGSTISEKIVNKLVEDGVLAKDNSKRWSSDATIHLPGVDPEQIWEQRLFDMIKQYPNSYSYVIRNEMYQKYYVDQFKFDARIAELKAAGKIHEIPSDETGYKKLSLTPAPAQAHAPAPEVKLYTPDDNDVKPF